MNEKESENFLTSRVLNARTPMEPRDDAQGYMSI
jgi:hypothetical protein